jgi:hypothetical protein
MAFGLTFLLCIPTLIIFWTIASRVPIREVASEESMQPIETYLDFKRPKDRERYRGDRKIPMAKFTEMYFDELVDFKMDCHEALERRYDWATFAFTPGLFRHYIFTMVPGVLLQTKGRGGFYLTFN